MDVEQNNAQHRHNLAGSERPRPETHKLIGPVAAEEQVAVTLVIRRKPGSPALPDLDYWRNTPLPEQRILTPAEYAATYGAHAGDLAKVEAFFASRGMTVRDSHGGRRTMTLRGTAAQMNELFGVVLNHYEAPVQEHPSHRPAEAGKEVIARTQRHRGFDGQVILPGEIAGVVTAVVGLDNRSAGGPAGAASGDPTNSNSLYVPQLAGYYNFPNLQVPEQTVAVIAPSDPPTVTSPRLSGYLSSDISNLYFPNLAVSYPAYGTAPASFNDIGVTVGSNSYSNTPSTNNFSQEVTQDISTSATIAQGCTMNVYFTELSENGLLVVLNRILLPEGSENQPTVVTCSFNFFGSDAGLGSPTDTSSAAYLMSEQFQQLAVVGVNCFMISQDFGSSGGDNDGNPHVVYPGSDPWVTSCGGTVVGNVQTSPSLTYDEYTWSNLGLATAVGGFNGATGGGASETYPIPSYQSAFGLSSITDSGGNSHSNRFVPDIAGMVSLTGFYLNGSSFGQFTGTSCAAPLYAGLFAVLRSALGRSLGFLNPILYELSSTFGDVTKGNNFSTDASTPYYTAGTGWDACTGLGHVDGTKLLNGIAGLFYNPNYYFEVNKGSFGLNEVENTPSYGGPSYPMWLVLEGYTPQAVTAAGMTPTVSVDLPGVTVSVGPAQSETSSLQSTPQRTLFPCTITFAKSAIATVSSPQGIFPAPGNPPTPTPVNLTSEIKIDARILAAATQLELEPGDDPFFSNFDAAGTNPFYLSNDLRVFTLTAGTSGTILGEPGLSPSNNTNFDTSAGYTYIQGLLSYMNQNYSNSSGIDPFTKFPDQTNALSGDSSVTPTSINPANPTGTPLTNYNFAVARVRLTGAEGSSGPNVRVLFRLFASETGDTDFQASTYPSTTDSEGQPLAPQLGADNVTIPFFATGNYESNGDFQVNKDYSANSINNQPVNIPASGSVWAYYGCYLNIYPTANTISVSGKKVAVQTLLPSSHSCVVAQLSYDNAPMPGAGVLQGPEWTTNFAQRNLDITYSDNPGPLATHRVPQTFDVRPSGPLGTGNLLDYPDELMIDWGSTPVGSTARIFWPQVKSADVLTLAGKIYSTHQLSAADDYTVRCTVPRGFTFVPIPPGTGQNYAGLFTVDLPKGVKAGQKFTIVVRRVATRQGVVVQPPPPIDQPKLELTSRATDGGPVIVNRNWRYIVGTFAVEIPVTTPKVMLPPEKNTLAILKWRLNEMEPANRWVPVLKRYIGYIQGRVNGLGGNSSTIQPSPWGAYGAPVVIHPEPVAEPEEFTGKIAGLIYDHFGDFEGFVLETAECETRRFCSREAKMEAVVRELWRERSVVTVVVKDKGSCCVIAVIAGYLKPCCEEKEARLQRVK